jgi:hypothetical protein
MIEVIMVAILALTWGETGPKCPETKDGPLGEPKYCSFVKNELCCEWRYVVDRFCIGADHGCTPAEKAADSMNALRSVEQWCYNFTCSEWTPNGDGYYNGWNSDDPLSIAQRKIRELVVRKKYKRAKKAAKKALKQLVSIGFCRKGKPCDDQLEFAVSANRKEMREAASLWVTDADASIVSPVGSGDESDSVLRQK